MTRTVKHIVIPAVAPAAIVGLYFTPPSLMGCAIRGLMALAVVLVAAISAFVTVGIALRGRVRNEPASVWWVVSTLILILPLALLLGPLG
jgi:Na+-driven multidrug efflux pump